MLTALLLTLADVRPGDCWPDPTGEVLYVVYGNLPVANHSTMLQLLLVRDKTTVDSSEYTALSNTYIVVDRPLSTV